MSYQSGFLKDRVTVLNRTATKASSFGSGAAGYTWTEAGTIWANVSFSKGAKAMHEGALDAYDIILVRTRYNDFLTRNSRIKFNGTLYNIDSFHADKQKNEIQITCTEIQG